MRISDVRKNILKKLNAVHAPLDVATLLKGSGANKTSIYRQLEKMLENGEIIQVEFGDGRKRYEVVARGHHHHLVCKDCGKIEELILEEVEENLMSLEKDWGKKTGFANVNHNLEFFGICRPCLAMYG